MLSKRLRHPVSQAFAIAVVGSISLWANADFSDPPRFDGAGYAVLAQSLIEGRGYREIDQPNAPRHAHFPPGYPLALAALWSVTGVSAFTAHAFSFGCTLAAMLLAWKMFRAWFRPEVAFLIALALAVNWRWARDGTAIQSEPLFLLLGQLALLCCSWIAHRGGFWRSVFLGVLLGAAMLTRHVGIALMAAVLTDLAVRGKRREAIVSFAVSTLMVFPWIGWLVVVKTNTQLGLLPMRGLTTTLSENALFYLRRLIDQIIGPVIEVATVFPEKLSSWTTTLSSLATVGAILADVLILLGWLRMIRNARRRPGGLVPLFTLLLLLIWPFTEAGRFLVPLIPFVIAGLVEGLAALVPSESRKFAKLRFKLPATPQPGSLGICWRFRSSRVLAARLVLLISLAFSVYAIASQRSAAARRTHRDFDAACTWIGQQQSGGSVLTRHPGEVFWLTGRTSLSPDSGDLDALITREKVAFLLIDDERFALITKSPLGRFVIENPNRVERSFASQGSRPVSVYRVLAKKPD